MSILYAKSIVAMTSIPPATLLASRIPLSNAQTAVGRILPAQNQGAMPSGHNGLPPPAPAPYINRISVNSDGEGEGNEKPPVTRPRRPGRPPISEAQKQQIQWRRSAHAAILPMDSKTGGEEGLTEEGCVTKPLGLDKTTVGEALTGKGRQMVSIGGPMSIVRSSFCILQKRTI
jgi:hypothetical protein